MRNSALFTAFFAVLSAVFLLSAGSALAGPKPWVFGWWPSHWKNLNFEKPYMYDGKSRHDSQWNGIDWAPADWVAQRESGLRLIDGWYEAGILRDQYYKNDVPVIEVGPAFYLLGGLDKRRVMETVDGVYGITASGPDALFQIRDEKSGKFIGLYSRSGLMVE